MIIAKWGDYTLECDNYSHSVPMYAVFHRVKYPSGATAFFQQCTKWYLYKKYAEDAYRKLTEGR